MNRAVLAEAVDLALHRDLDAAVARLVAAGLDRLAVGELRANGSLAQLPSAPDAEVAVAWLAAWLGLDCGPRDRTESAQDTPRRSPRRDPSDVSGQRVRALTGTGLVDVHAAFDELLLMPDHGAINVALAGVVANYASGDPVWPLLVGPPGCGKSEIVSSLIAAADVWPLSSLTPQTLLSGFERKGEPASLLLQIGRFGIIAFKDLTTVLTMHRDARGEIIGQLREVADGRTEKSFGNGLRVEWEGKLGLIAGVTPVIDEQHAFLAVMGERFVLWRMPEVTRRDLARRSLARRGNEAELRERIRDTTADFLQRFRDCGRLELPDSFHEPLVVLADVVTRARSGVAPDGYSRDLLYLPEPEAPGRLAKQLAQLAAAALAIGVPADEAWRLVRKIGWDSVPAVRCTVLAYLARQADPVPIAAIEEQTGLPRRTVTRVVEDLVVLRLVDRRKDAGKWLVEQSAIAHDYWAGERWPETSEGVQVGGHDAAGRQLDADEVERLAAAARDAQHDGKETQ